MVGSGFVKATTSESHHDSRIPQRYFERRSLLCQILLLMKGAKSKCLSSKCEISSELNVSFQQADCTVVWNPWKSERISRIGTLIYIFISLQHRFSPHTPVIIARSTWVPSWDESRAALVRWSIDDSLRFNLFGTQFEINNPNEWALVVWNGREGWVVTCVARDPIVYARYRQHTAQRSSIPEGIWEKWRWEISNGFICIQACSNSLWQKYYFLQYTMNLTRAPWDELGIQSLQIFLSLTIQ